MQCEKLLFNFKKVRWDYWCGSNRSYEVAKDVTPQNRYHEDSSDFVKIRTYRFWGALLHDMRDESHTWCKRNYHKKLQYNKFTIDSTRNI
jgi:hypothetical protein